MQSFELSAVLVQAEIKKLNKPLILVPANEAIDL
jgi:hypothetical protein